MATRVASVVEVIVLEPIALPDPKLEPLRFRIEILRWGVSDYTCQVFRLETYRLTPSLAGDWKQPSDMTIHVLETSLGWESIRRPTIEKVRAAVLELISSTFGVTLDRSP